MDVSRALKNPGQAFPFEATVEIEPLEYLADPLDFADVSVRGELLCTGSDRVSVTGEIAARADTRCSRCLEPVSFPISAELNADYDRQPDPEDPDLYSFEASTIELTDAVRDALLLNMPMRVLCGEDCRGLCPRCGANLNRTTCTCQEGAEVTNPFSALKNIVLKDEEV